MTTKLGCVAFGMLVVGCGTKVEPTPNRALTRQAADPGPVDATNKAPQPAPELVEHDMSVLGDLFKGYTVMAPRDAKLEIVRGLIRLTDEDRVSLDWAPGWDNELARLSQDDMIRNVRKISDTEIRYERGSLSGVVGYGIEVKIDIGGRPWRCYTDDPSATGATYSGPVMAERIANICYSIKKKK